MQMAYENPPFQLAIMRQSLISVQISSMRKEWALKFSGKMIPNMPESHPLTTKKKRVIWERD